MQVIVRNSLFQTKSTNRKHWVRFHVREIQNITIEEQIKFLRKLHFRWVKTAQLLGISENTLRRKRAAYGTGSAIGDPDYSDHTTNQ